MLETSLPVRALVCTLACIALLPARAAEAELPGATAHVDLSPAHWPDRARYDAMLTEVPTATGKLRDQPMATGANGAVTGTYSAPAMRAGLEALRQGGTSVDAALTTAITQVTLAAGTWVSYAGLMSVVHYDADSGRVYSLNAAYDTVRGETEPLTIPAADFFNDMAGGRIAARPNGRQALVPGFMRGVEAAHGRFGKLPFAALFDPAIWYAERGFPLSSYQAEFFATRMDALTRLPEGRAIFLKRDGRPHAAGDTFRQIRLAAFLRAIASQGADYMYRGEWAKRAVAAIRQDGGRMTLEDLERYAVIWQEPLRGRFRDYDVVGNGLPAAGGLNVQEALNTWEASGLIGRGHWTKSGETLFWLSQISELMMLSLLPPATRDALGRAVDLPLDDASRLTRRHAAEIWRLMSEKKVPFLSGNAVGPRHSDVVVAADRWGNMTAVVHSVNSLGDIGLWVDGVSINNSAGFQQSAIAAAGLGKRLPDPTTPMLLLRDGKPVMAAGSMSPGLHQKTLQSLINVVDYGMTPKEAIDAPYLMAPQYRPKPGVDVSNPSTLKPGDIVPTYKILAGAVPAGVLDDARGRGVAIEEVPVTKTRMSQGLFVAIDRDPATGAWRAAAPDVTNGVALAY